MAKKKKLNKKGRALLMLLFIVLFAAGITIFTNMQKNDSKKDSSNSKSESKTKPKKEEKKLQIIDLDSDSRNYAVMINNIKTVWGYQSGLQDAYMVYEIIVEGGYTRLMAVFKDKSLDRLGSVRSSRHYFLDYALENDAIYIHFGWSPQAESDFKVEAVSAKLSIEEVSGSSFHIVYTRNFRDFTLSAILIILVISALLFSTFNFAPSSIE